MSEGTPLMIMAQECWPWGSKTAVKKVFPNGYMDSELFLISFTSFYKNRTSKIQNSYIWWLLPMNVGFTKSVLKSLNLIFSHVNFVYKTRKWNVSINILFYYIPNFLNFWKIVFHLFCLHKVWKTSKTFVRL